MQSREQRCKELFNRWYQRQLADTELPELWELLSEADLEGKLEPMMQAAYDQLKEDTVFSGRQIRQMADAITHKQETPVRFFKVSRWSLPAYRRMAAASIILLLGAGGYFFFQHKSEIKNHTPEIVSHDVKAPVTNRAMITLANGRTVYLDSTANGALATQGNMQLVKLADGKIEYKASLNPSKGGGQVEAALNTLTNPRGSNIIDMMLSDGSHVWLNAGSSVTYPVVFAGHDRKVQITGEAYFEVVHDAAKPFYVSKGNMQVQVLGTHFNVNAYDDEGDIKVTLLQGSVKVSNDADSKTIEPGQQARVAQNTPLAVGNVDTEAVMAWKNGYFQLSGANIQSIMRQVARLYDVEIVYEGAIPSRQFGGQMPRSVNLSEILQILRESKVNCRVEGNKVIVTN